MNEFWDDVPVNKTEICPSEVLENIKSGIKDYHKGAPHNIPPIQSDIWECIVANAFRKANFDCIWYGENGNKTHEIGKDITVNELTYKNISCKSGELKYKKKIIFKSLKISSYRTTKYKTIDEKLNYIDSEHEDIVYSLSSTFYYSSNRRYILTIFIQPKFKELSWFPDKKNIKNYKSSKLNGLRAWINSSQSDQLWYELERNCPLIKEQHEIQF